MLKKLFLLHVLILTLPNLVHARRPPSDELGSGVLRRSPYPQYRPQNLMASRMPASYFEGNRAQLREYNNLYRRFGSHQKLRGSLALEKALAFYVKNKDGIPETCGGDFTGGSEIKNRKFISFTDYTLPHDQDRQFILNLETGEVASAPAAHGYGSNSNCPPEHVVDCRSMGRGYKCAIPSSPGDVPDSGQQPRGFFLTGEGYQSGQSTFRNGTPAANGTNAIRLHGLQTVNSNALSRYIVWHRASYVNSDSVNECSSSAGCPSTDPRLFEEYKDDMGEGAMMYLHSIEDQEKIEPDC